MENVEKVALYTGWSILIYNPKYLLKYFIYEKIVGQRLTRTEGDIWTPIFDCGFKRAGNFTSKMTVEKWLLWPWKGKKLRPNIWETTRCPFSEFSWFFGVNKRSRCFTKIDEMLKSTSPWPSWTSAQFSRWLEGQDDFS